MKTNPARRLFGLTLLVPFLFAPLRGAEPAKAAQPTRLDRRKARTRKLLDDARMIAAEGDSGDVSR